MCRKKMEASLRWGSPEKGKLVNPLSIKQSEIGTGSEQKQTLRLMEVRQANLIQG